MKKALLSVVRYVWFAALVLFALGYLTSGLSKPHSASTDSQNSAANVSLSDQTESKNHLESKTHLEGLRAVEASLAQSWETQGVVPAEIADWLTICRRMSLSLVGNGLSLEEIRSLQSLPESEREAVHLESLLNDSRFHDYWGERWTRFLVGADEGPFLVYRRRRFRVWLSEQFAANQRYDEMVKRLVAAEGLWTDRPEVNFLTVTFDSNDGQPDPVRLAARTSRAFLGLRIDCLQCHNDFLGNVSLGELEDLREGQQSDFHQLAAFYTAAKTNGLQGVRENQVDYKYQYLGTDDEINVEPSVPYSADLLPKNGKPRERLAAWITHPENCQSARAAVSHVWALLFGRSATDAVDNLPLDAPVPPHIDVLATQFVKSGFNMRHLIRLIVKSSAFRVSSRAESEITELHEDAAAVFPLTRLRPEQVAGSIIQSSRIKKVDRDSSFLVQLQKFGDTNDFVKRYGDMGEDEFTGNSVTISQRLTMLNGKLLRESISDNPVLNASSHIRRFSNDDGQAVESIYLCVLNRYPSNEEREHFVNRLKQSGGRLAAIEDLYWILLNSTEFAWNH